MKYKLIIIFIFFFYLLALNINYNNIFKASYNLESIDQVEGYVVKDQSKTSNGNYYFKIKADRAILKDKSVISVKGQIPVLFKKDYDLLFLTPIRLKVEYNKEIKLFNAKEVYVLESNNRFFKAVSSLLFKLRNNRVYLLKKINSYIHTPMARMLILGRCDQDGFIFKNYALKLGCAHLLALSGMHLSIIALFFSKIISKFFSKNKSKYISLIFIIYFIYITGPIASLVRSFIMYILGLVKFKYNLRSELILLFTAILQAIIFPMTFISAGCLFSYGALSAIFIYSSIFHIKNKILNPILTTVFAIVITYPLSLSLGGAWCVLSMFLSPFLTIFVTLEMIVALIILINSVIVDFAFYYIFRNGTSILEAVLKLISNILREINYYLHVLIHNNEKLIRFIFSWANNVNEKLPKFLINREGYIFFVIIVLTTTVVYLYSRDSFKFRSKVINELGFPI